MERRRAGRSSSPEDGGETAFPVRGLRETGSEAYTATFMLARSARVAHSDPLQVRVDEPTPGVPALEHSPGVREPGVHALDLCTAEPMPLAPVRARGERFESGFDA